MSWQTALVLGRAALAISCVAGAVVLIVMGREHWGWLLFFAFVFGWMTFESDAK